MFRLITVILMLALSSPAAIAASPYIIVQSTTSTQNSGLFDHILPRFEARSGIDVRVVAVGTGQALRNAANGDGDVVIVHAPAAEQAFVAAGHGIERRQLMYNDFILVGPEADPAAARGTSNIHEAFRRIAAARAPFVSRGDDSGTHKRELELWQTAGLDPAGASGTWYRETGSGMGPSLNVATAMAAYTLCDRGTWVAFGNKAGLDILFEGGDALHNQYSVIVVDGRRHPGARVEAARNFADWLVSPAGQAAIASFHVDGQQLFHPNAAP